MSIGIGPFVIEPALSRKMGKTATAEMTLDADWKSASWATQKGLFTKILENTSELDIEVANLSNKLASFSPESLAEIKKVFWEGTENWEELLYERAEISGKLVLSDFSKNKLIRLKNK
jgi:methylglutaconyl-CoA hydratase